MEKQVFVSKCDNYNYDQVATAVNRTLDAFGGAEAILNGGRRVLVKPNILIPKKPEDAATTHPVVLEAVCAAFVKAGADVAVIDSTGSPHTKVILRLLYGRTGIKAATRRAGATPLFDTKTSAVSYPEGKIFKEFEILSPVYEADLVVSLAKAKTHGFMAMTGCVKNMFGCIPGMGKPRLHHNFPKREDFAAMLVDLCEFIKPGFSILDAIVGMEGQGPASGDPKQIGAIVGSTSPYAVDLVQSYLMGLRTDTICTIQEAIARGLSPSNVEEMTLLGDDPKPLRASFKPATENKNDNIPTILENCTGCAACARVCPMKCVKIEKKKAVIKEKECIRCYCCHEFCPEKAISLE